MVEFNEDGSIKLPERFQQQQKDQEKRMQNTRCITVQKEVVSFDAPKKCLLTITPSKQITDTKFVENIYIYFIQHAETPTKLSKKENHFEVEVGSSFRRCSECTRLVGRLREHLDGNLIEKKGNCTYQGIRNFSYEDHFE